MGSNAGSTQQSNGYTARSLRLHLPTSSRASPGACLLVVAPSKQASFEPRNRQALLSDLLSAEIESSGCPQRPCSTRQHPGAERPDALYDAVIGNPPYGRILRPPAAIRQRPTGRFFAVISSPC